MSLSKKWTWLLLSTMSPQWNIPSSSLLRPFKYVWAVNFIKVYNGIYCLQSDKYRQQNNNQQVAIIWSHFIFLSTFLHPSLLKKENLCLISLIQIYATINKVFWSFYCSFKIIWTIKNSSSSLGMMRILKYGKLFLNASPSQGKLKQREILRVTWRHGM